MWICQCLAPLRGASPAYLGTGLSTPRSLRRAPQLARPSWISRRGPARPRLQGYSSALPARIPEDTARVRTSCSGQRNSDEQVKVGSRMPPTLPACDFRQRDEAWSRNGAAGVLVQFKFSYAISACTTGMTYRVAAFGPEPPRTLDRVIFLMASPSKGQRYFRATVYRLTTSRRHRSARAPARRQPALSRQQSWRRQFTIPLHTQVQMQGRRGCARPG